MLKCLPGSTQPTLLFYSSDDGMVKVHNNTIRRKWKEGPRGERVEEGEILKGESVEGLMGNYIWRLVAAGSGQIEVTARRDCALCSSLGTGLKTSINEGSA